MRKILTITILLILIFVVNAGPGSCLPCVIMVCLGMASFCGAAVYGCFGSGPLFFNCVSAACGVAVSSLKVCYPLCAAPTP